MTDPVPTPEHPTDEAYEAALRILARRADISGDDRWLLDDDLVRAIAGAVWDLGVTEGRQQAAREIRAEKTLTMFASDDYYEVAARIAEGDQP